jgi:hypothetical protein
MKDDLYSIQPTSRHTFIEFLNLLTEDYKNNQSHWENDNLGSFLEAMSRYAQDIDGYYINMAKDLGKNIDPDIPSWQVFADILRGSIVYE